MTRGEVPLDAARILQVLFEFDVAYAIIGGLAVQAHGHTRTTQASTSRRDRIPPPGAPYAEPAARALVIEVAGVSVLIAGRDDLIAMKRASGRPIDRGDVIALTASERAAPTDR